MKNSFVSKKKIKRIEIIKNCFVKKNQLNLNTGDIIEFSVISEFVHGQLTRSIFYCLS